MSLIIHGDCLEELKNLPDDSVDVVITDPPYGYSFMGKDWDKAVPSVEIWEECLRVLKPGAFACVMSAPRSDVQQAMTERLIRAGFRLDFTPIYWTYASGFPKAGNVSKLVDKRGGVLLGRDFCELIKKRRLELGLTKTQLAALGGFHGAVNHGGSVSNWEEGKGSPTLEQYNKLIEVLQLENERLTPGEREVISRQSMTFGVGGASDRHGSEKVVSLSATDQAKALDGSYAGFQPKPAVEVVIIAMKPLSEKTYVDQALKNGHGVSWLDDGRIPTGEDIGVRPPSKPSSLTFAQDAWTQDPNNRKPYSPKATGRFPANLLVSDDVLNDGVERKTHGGGDRRSTKHSKEKGWGFEAARENVAPSYDFKDSGSYSRYFDLDKWAEHNGVRKECACVGVEMGTFTRQTSMKTPFKTYRDDSWVSIDTCIVQEIAELWALGVETLSSCCGHNTNRGYIAVNKNSIETMESLGYTHLSQDVRQGDNSEFFYPKLTQIASTFPFAIFPKASKSEKNKGLEYFDEVIRSDRQAVENIGANNPRNRTGTAKKNHHPTVKPLKLMSYLITLFSRPGDTVLDPFVGSGTTVVAAEQLGRHGIGIEREAEYAEIARARLAHIKPLPEEPETVPPVTIDEVLEPKLVKLEQMRLL